MLVNDWVRILYKYASKSVLYNNTHFPAGELSRSVSSMTFSRYSISWAASYSAASWEGEWGGKLAIRETYFGYQCQKFESLWSNLRRSSFRWYAQIPFSGKDHGLYWVNRPKIDFNVSPLTRSVPHHNLLGVVRVDLECADHSARGVYQLY